MALRAYWKGYLKLSLVSCPVALYPGSSASERIGLRTINRQTGNRLKQQMVDAVTGEPVDAEDRGKGYEVGRDRYLPVAEEELEGIEIASSHTIDVERFVPRDEIDERYLDAPYYLAPTDTVGQEAFAVIREAMRDKRMVGLAKVVLYRRERLLMLEPLDKGLLATSLRYAYEIRDPAPYFEDIPDLELPAEMRDLAAHIIAGKAGHFEPASFEDRYENALIELLRRKQAGVVDEPAKPKQASAQVINLMDALRKSVAADRGDRGTSAGQRAQPAAAKTERKQPARKQPARAAAAKPAAKSRKGLKKAG
jgi:DNA end-binding protein Ku